MFRIFVISLLAFMSSAFADCAVDQFLQSGTCVSCPANSTSDGGNVSSCTCNPGFSVDGTPSGSSVATNRDCVFAPKFFVTVTLGSANKFEFKISAAGNFYIDWGDNSPIESIEGKGTTNTAYSHSYAAGTYTIGITGDVTAYNASTTTAAIDFGYNSTYKKYITGISGSLGALFPTLANGSQPVFYKTFYGCSALNGPIPENLFDGIHGDTVPNMFRSTFENCSSLDGPLPTDLFSGLTGTPAQDSFKNTLKKTLVTGTVTTALFGDMDITTGGNNLDGMFNGVTTLNTTCPDGSASISNVTDATICEASTTTEPEVCEPGYWLNGENCEPCPEGFYCADNAQLVCDPEYPMSASGASQATECYKNCTAECTPTCPSNASCTHETSDTAGIEYFGGICDAPESACEIITITCEPGYWLNGENCEPCPEGFYCADNAQLVCDPEYPMSAPGASQATECYKNCTAECTPTCPSNASCTHETSDTAGIEYFGGICDAPESACEIITITCEPGYWLNGENCEPCPEGFYCADNAQLVCDPEYPMSAPGASQATECYKNCTAECTPTCPSNASCTHETSDTAGIEYFGGICDAPESACEIITITCEPGYVLKGDVCEKEVITCETGYWLNGDECELCPAGSFCANNKKSLCNPEFPDSVPGSNDLTDCYKSCTAECTPTCPSNATCTHEITSNTGIQYYGEECNAAVSACQIISVACNDGFEMVDGVCKSTMDAEFIITTTELSDGATFSFSISAAGTYYIDCDDGKGVQVKEKTNTNMETYTCSYAKGGVKHIGLSGQATQYHSGSSAAISFSGNKSLAGISGSLGAIFSTLPDGSNPKFYQTFNLCTSLQGVIPQNLFKGVYGTASEAMFRSTFEGCSGLTGTLPDGMFADITGGDIKYLFYNTFYKCSGLQGSIPSNMFAGISGNLTSSMFAGTFRLCSGLTGYIPYNLFANINASSYKSGMLKQIFEGTGLDTSCPVNTYQFITGFEDDFSNKVACAPCPDGGQSPAGSTSVDQCTGGTVVCLEGEYKNEDDVCVDCPVDKPYSLGGATDVRMCFASEIRKLHVGDALIGLLRNQQTTPALHVKIDNVVYYGALTDQETVMSPESNKKLKVQLNNIIYYLYDQTRMLDLQ